MNSTGKTKTTLIGDKHYKLFEFEDKSFKIQGYEDKFLSTLEDFSISHHDLYDDLVIQFMDKQGKSRKYYPDFIDYRTNTIYEIKSGWTHSTWKFAEEKIEETLAQGYSLVIVIYHDRKDKNPRILKYGKCESGTI